MVICRSAILRATNKPVWTRVFILTEPQSCVHHIAHTKPI
uniref:Uncharacterized protein n=1 Tax=Anguilla anguilla TaxID=7936 RepID=A0A0E9QGD0_ANGAN